MSEPSRPVKVPQAEARDRVRRAAQAVRERLKPRAVDAPPALQGAPVFRSNIRPRDEADGGTLVIMCSGQRFAHPTLQLITQHLKVRQCDYIAVPGGVQWLALPDYLPKHNKVARGMAEFLTRHHRIGRIICVAHEDCSAYEKEGALGAIANLVGGRSIPEIQLDQLRKVGGDLAEWLGVKVELYYASLEPDGQVAFRDVTLTQEEPR